MISYGFRNRFGLLELRFWMFFLAFFLGTAYLVSATIWNWNPLLCILHGIGHIWPCSPSMLHGICCVLALQPLICMIFATFFRLRVSLEFH